MSVEDVGGLPEGGLPGGGRSGGDWRHEDQLVLNLDSASVREDVEEQRSSSARVRVTWRVEIDFSTFLT